MGTFDRGLRKLISPVDDDSGVYKVIIKAEDYPNAIPIPQLFSKGDTLILQDATPVKIGDRHKKYPAKVTQIFYEPRKWWQFWKKKKQSGYMLQWE